jgi:Tol biopolymer transport system component
VRDLATGAITLVSANAARTDSGNALSETGRFAADGRHVVFLSGATDLTAAAGGPGSQWYAYDVTTGETNLLTENATGGGATSGGLPAGTGIPEFSRDGTKVLLATDADDLGPADTDGHLDIYLRDLVAGTTTLISRGVDGDALLPIFSPDATTVVYMDFSSGIDPRDTNGVADLYAYDVPTGATRLLTLDVTGSHAGDGPVATGANMSPDGRAITFVSAATDLVPTDTNGAYDHFVMDLASGATTLVSVNAAGTDSGGGDPGQFFDLPGQFSADGTKILFKSAASTLTTVPDNNGFPDAFVRDLVAGTTTLASTGTAGTGTAGTVIAAMSPEGDLVAFVTTNGLAGTVDHNGIDDVYVRDLAGETTSLVTHNAARTDGAPGPGGTGRLVFSPTGRQIAFDTFQFDMGPPDANGQPDVYVATLRRADLALTLDAAPAAATTGGTMTYTIDVTNHGDAADDASVLVRMPDGTDGFGLSSTPGSCDAVTGQPRLFVCGLGTLATGANARIVVTAGVTAPSGATLTAAALASTATAEPHRDDNAAVVDTPVTG